MDAAVDPMRPLPREGRIYEQTLRAGLGDCAPSGRTRLDALARWFQDVAYADVEDAGVADAAVWVVRRSRIQVQRFPRFGERFRVLTFCSGIGRMWAERRTSLVPADADSTGDTPARSVAEGLSLWVHLDPDSRRPSLLTARELELYEQATGGHRVNARLRHPLLPGDPTEIESVRGWEFHAVDCDIAAHVNNTAYWKPLEEELIEGPEPLTIDAEIEFRSGAQPGLYRYQRTGQHGWLTGEEDAEIYASTMLYEAPPAVGG